jgi:hypothetical protein
MPFGWCNTPEASDRIAYAFQQVYVLDDQKQLVMVMGMKPTDVEKSINNITK